MFPVLVPVEAGAAEPKLSPWMLRKRIRPGMRLVSHC